MNNKLERMWAEMTMFYIEVHSRNSLGGIEKNKEHLRALGVHYENRTRHL
jgi:hypothetical protein